MEQSASSYKQILYTEEQFYTQICTVNSLVPFQINAFFNTYKAVQERVMQKAVFFT